MRGEVHVQQFGEEKEDDDDDQTKVLCDLCSMIAHILRSPPLPISFSGFVGQALSSRTSQASPAAFASLFLGVSVALMLFGSVTFAIGFFLMPLVIGLLMLFYFVGMIYNLSELGRTIFCPGYPSTSNIPAPEFQMKTVIC